MSTTEGPLYSVYRDEWKRSDVGCALSDIEGWELDQLTLGAVEMCDDLYDDPPGCMERLFFHALGLRVKRIEDHELRDRWQGRNRSNSWSSIDGEQRYKQRMRRRSQRARWQFRWERRQIDGAALEVLEMALAVRSPSCPHHQSPPAQ